MAISKTEVEKGLSNYLRDDFIGRGISYSVTESESTETQEAHKTRVVVIIDEIQHVVGPLHYASVRFQVQTPSIRKEKTGENSRPVEHGLAQREVSAALQDESAALIDAAVYLQTGDVRVSSSFFVQSWRDVDGDDVGRFVADLMVKIGLREDDADATGIDFVSYRAYATRLQVQEDYPFFLHVGKYAITQEGSGGAPVTVKATSEGWVLVCDPGSDSGSGA
jgi:hypothetical protein